MVKLYDHSLRKSSETICIDSGLKSSLRLHKSKTETRKSPLSVLILPATDRILQAGQARGVRFFLSLEIDQPLHHGPVASHLAEQVIKQRGFPQRAAE